MILSFAREADEDFFLNYIADNDVDSSEGDMMYLNRTMDTSFELLDGSSTNRSNDVEQKNLS